VLKKYGKDNFACEIVEKCDTLDELNERESYWIEYFQSRNPEIGYNLAKGGDSVCVGCTDEEIQRISKALLYTARESIFEVVADLQRYGLRIYEQGDSWSPTSTNSTGEKMKAVDNSIVISFYTKHQYSLTQKYAGTLDCPYWKYNMLVEIEKIPALMVRLKEDYEAGNIISETFKGPGRGTTGIFIETQKHTKSARMPIVF
jgi:hypothetical protein